MTIKGKVKDDKRRLLNRYLVNKKL